VIIIAPSEEEKSSPTARAVEITGVFPTLNALGDSLRVAVFGGFAGAIAMTCMRMIMKL